MIISHTSFKNRLAIGYDNERITFFFETDFTHCPSPYLHIQREGL